MTTKKRDAINLLVENQHTKTDIARMLGISRTTLYEWTKEEEFKMELDECLRKIQTYGENQIKANLAKCIDNVVNLANHAESEKIRTENNHYLIDRVLGKTTAKIDLTADARGNEEEVTSDIIEQEFNEIEEE